MDEHFQLQLIRQLKILNTWVSIFGSLVLVTLVTLGVLVFKIVNFAQDTRTKISDIQQKTSQTFNVKDDICANKTITKLLGSKADKYCD